jgi:hypothetical protein
MSKKLVARKSAQKPDFVPVRARLDMTSFGPGLAWHDSSGRAQAATSARRAAQHDFYRTAQPLTPSRPHLPSAPIKSYPFSLCHSHGPQSHLGMATRQGGAGGRSSSLPQAPIADPRPGPTSQSGENVPHAVPVGSSKPDGPRGDKHTSKNCKSQVKR